MTRRLWIALLALLVIVGLVPATGRSVDALIRITRPRANRPDLANSDRYFERIYVAQRLAADSSSEKEVRTDFDSFLGKFGRHPWATLGHTLPGSLFFLLIPFQFNGRLRRRYPAVHRWTGRVVLLSVPILVGAACYYALGMPYGGLTETSAVLVFGAFILVAGWRGFLAIRARRISEHRDWMTRMFGIGLGVAIQRLLGAPVFFLRHGSPRAWFGPSLWAGFILGAIGAEWVVRRRRGAPPIDPPPVRLGDYLTTPKGLEARALR